MHFYLHVLEVCIIVLVSAHCLCRLPCGVELVIISYLISLKLVLNYCLDHPIFFWPSTLLPPGGIYQATIRHRSSNRSIQFACLRTGKSWNGIK